MALAQGADAAALAADWLELDRFGPRGTLRHLAGLTATRSGLDAGEMAALIARLAEGPVDVARLRSDLDAIRKALGAGGPGQVMVKGAAAPCCEFRITEAHGAYWSEVVRILDNRELRLRLARGAKKSPGLKIRTARDEPPGA